MPDLTDDKEWDTPKNLAMVLKATQIASQMLLNQYSYNDVARMITIQARRALGLHCALPTCVTESPVTRGIQAAV